MQIRTVKVRARRRLLKRQRQVENLGTQAEAHLERHFFRRLGNLGPVWRFITSWMLLWVLIIGVLGIQIESLSGHFQTLMPIPGGSFIEGIVGTFSNADPLYATSNVDLTVSRLMFSSLLKYDDHNRLVGDLATDWTVDKTGMIYTVHLRHDARWQDGKPLTAKDVVFTYDTIQNPNAQSPLNGGWQGIAVSSPASYTVMFRLPNPLSSFPASLTNGIVPEHILSKIDAVDLRSDLFNTQNPVGSGAFSWQAVNVSRNTPATTETQIELTPFDDYYDGKPKLGSFVVHAFATEQAMIASFRQHNLTAMAGVSALPADLTKNSSVTKYSPLLTAAKMAFFNTSQGALQDANVRRALVEGSDPMAIINNLGYSTLPVREPLLLGQLGYNAKYGQITAKQAAAKALLDNDGWKLAPNGIRSKKGQPLTFDLYTFMDSENNLVSKMLQQQWRALGVRVNVHQQDFTDFNNVVASRGYDILLYGISIGADPDVFVYWDSSQSHSNTGQNYSLWGSADADASLEAGRTRTTPQLRAIKYQPFLAAWQKDAPALGLYQPRFLYVSWARVYGFNLSRLNNGVDRFNNVQNWEIRVAKVTD